MIHGNVKLLCWPTDENDYTKSKCVKHSTMITMIAGIKK